MNVGNSSKSFFVDDHLHLPLIDIVLLQEALDKEASVVGRSIIHDDHVVVGVLLVEDGLQVELVTEGLGIIVSGHDDTEGQLTVVPTQVIGLLQPPLLLLPHFFHLPQIVARSKLIPHVGLLHKPVVLPHRIAEVVIVGQLLKLPYPFVPYPLLHQVLKQIQ